MGTVWKLCSSPCKADDYSCYCLLVLTASDEKYVYTEFSLAFTVL